MARKRNNAYRRPRQAPGSERSYYAYQVDLPAPATSRAELVRMVRGGEDTFLELKVRFSNVEKLTAEIIALANTSGGAMVFGVNDQLRVEGVENGGGSRSPLPGTQSPLQQRRKIDRRDHRAGQHLGRRNGFRSQRPVARRGRGRPGRRRDGVARHLLQLHSTASLPLHQQGRLRQRTPRGHTGSGH